LLISYKDVDVSTKFIPKNEYMNHTKFNVSLST